MPARTLLVLVVAVLAALPGTAHAQDTAERIGFGASTREQGWVALRVEGPAGTTVSITAAGADAPLRERTLDGGPWRIRHAQRWDCSGQAAFTAAFTLPDGTTATQRTQVRTPSCRDRLALARVTRRPRAGRPVAFRVRDRWGIGAIAGRVCLRTLSGATRCARAELPEGRAATVVRAGARSPGDATATLRTRFGQRQRVALRVRPRGPLRILATGDSMIQVFDHVLRERVPGARVTTSDHISTGISKPFMLNWPALARRQAAALRPDVTVVFLGANDGFPFGDAACCGRAWIDAYARRVATMMRTYRRGGRGHVVWMTLPPTSRASFARVFVAVNAAIRQAARKVGPGVTVVDVGRGVPASMRQSDGVHLSTAGASRAAGLVAAALRRDGLSG